VTWDWFSTNETAQLTIPANAKQEIRDFPSLEKTGQGRFARGYNSKNGGPPLGNGERRQLIRW